HLVDSFKNSDLDWPAPVELATFFDRQIRQVMGVDPKCSRLFRTRQESTFRPCWQTNYSRKQSAFRGTRTRISSLLSCRRWCIPLFAKLILMDLTGSSISLRNAQPR